MVPRLDASTPASNKAAMYNEEDYLQLREEYESRMHQVLQEVEHGIGLIQRQGFERAGNRINSFRPDAA